MISQTEVLQGKYAQRTRMSGPNDYSRVDSTKSNLSGNMKADGMLDLSDTLAFLPLFHLIQEMIKARNPCYIEIFKFHKIKSCLILNNNKVNVAQILMS
uniref:Uncharacterized protein n=1 Tax=Octopus bimaculoides TaxID=37653 RepID=A0A0L8HFW7_OCTBM